MDSGIPQPLPIGRDGASLTDVETPVLEFVTRIRVDYTIHYNNSEAEVSYSYPVDTPVILAGGSVLAAGYLQVGDQFCVDDGAVAVVTDVGEPIDWETFDSEQCRTGENNPRILGTVKYTGVFEIVAFQVFGGDWIETTPEHCFWSVKKQSWEPISDFQCGDQLSTGDGPPARIASITAPYSKRCELRNIEVEEVHSFKVGDSHGGVWTHNGLTQVAVSPKPQHQKANRKSAPPQPTAKSSTAFLHMMHRRLDCSLLDSPRTFEAT